MSSWKLQYAARQVKSGGIIAYPTEAVYGLGCDPFNFKAVSRLLELKQRPMSKGLIVLVSDNQGLLDILGDRLDTERVRTLNEAWPGPRTFLLPVADLFPAWVRGSHMKVAVRITSHPLAAELVRQCGGFLVSTSANVASHPPAKSLLQVRQAFKTELDYILPGELGNLGAPTPIVDIVSQEIVRN